MKNKRLKKMLISSAMDIIYALLLTLVTLIFTKNILNYLYKYTASTLVWYIWDFWRTIKYTLFNGIFAYIMIFLVFISFYLLITYRRTKSLVDIIDQTEIMADGDLDRLIEVDINNDMKILADNINSISRKLKERTIEERIAQKTKNDLITNVSHDLRTPLTSIMGYLEIIDKDKYEDEVRLRYYASIAYEKAKSLSLLINDLFELTKMQNNSIKLNKSIINLVELVGQVTAYFEYQFKKADMEARINFSEDKLIVKGDGEKLVRVFENLLSNAIKYGQEGYYVDIVTRAEEDMAVVQVINYGEAIPSVDLPYIFDRFYRIEKSRNSNKGGSGLGLAITKNIVELHGGKISAYSDDDKTVFEVKLPMEE
ncbi:MAG: HAMP domain-containing histidine kinase [Clostridiales bacterium]|uniref:histidine kinase n=1 Tax=Clostridium isatidis TaxID=182773 RepID=A0A343JEC0_9CLOT|nr:HAMP domain-containing sensor histidine kinase [Clostridium isatidis]ASW43878.1 two-component sensor histidine kinase [Clostridium isatidis]NLZ49759.1 HAMP domain-containing histidine kinase [Clostridiales bacterium]